MKIFYRNLYKIILISNIFFLQIFSATNKTFFMTKPIGQDLVYQYAMINQFVNNSDTLGNFQISATPFYQESTNGKDLTKYFFPNNKTNLIIKAENVSGDKDIDAGWLLIEDEGYNRIKNFESKLTMKPEQKTFGLNLKFIKTLNFLSDNLQLSFFLPFIQKETKLKVNEYDIQNEPAQIKPIDCNQVNHNAKDALSSPNTIYSRFSEGKLKLAGLADISMKITYFFKKNYSQKLGIYGSIIIPTGYKPTAEYIFEPIIGNSKRFGLGLGINSDINLIDNEKYTLNLITIAEYNLLLKNKQKRTFDLQNKPWSRYLFVRTENENLNFGHATIPFTLYSTLQQQSIFNALIGVHYSKKFLNMEVGYNLWLKEKEKIHLNNFVSDQYSVTAFDVADAGFYPQDYLAKTTTIADNPFIAGTTFDAIQQADLNLQSAAHPSALSNKIYFSTGFNGNWNENIFEINLGTSYEFGTSNTSLSQWSLWLQINLSI